jgi:TPR repeat protein
MPRDPNETMRTLTAAILFALALHGTATAGLAEGATAYNARNYALALKEVTPLARAGNADAQHLLGLMYYMGRGVPRDYKQAFQWHYKAAEQGHPDAQHALGLMYRYHVAGMPQDMVLAYMLWNLAAAGGHRNAIEQRAMVAKQMTQEQIDEAQAMSRTWKPGMALPTQSHTGGVD